MAARRTWTEHKVQRFRDLIAKGLARDIIAERLDKTLPQLTSLYQHLRCMGETLPPLMPVEVRKQPASALDGKDAEIAEMSRKGLGATLIARQLGVSRLAVCGFMHRRDLYARRRSYGPPPQVLRLPVNLARLNLPDRAAEADVRLGEAMWRAFEEMAG